MRFYFIWGKTGFYCMWSITRFYFIWGKTFTVSEVNQGFTVADVKWGFTVSEVKRGFTAPGLLKVREAACVIASVASYFAWRLTFCFSFGLLIQGIRLLHCHGPLLMIGLNVRATWHMSGSSQLRGKIKFLLLSECQAAPWSSNCVALAGIGKSCSLSEQW